MHLTFTYPKYKVSNVSYSFLQTNGSTVTDLVTYYTLLCLILFVLVQFEDLVSYYALLCLFSFDFVFVQFEEFVFPAFILVFCVRVFGSPGRCTCGRVVHIVCRREPDPITCACPPHMLVPFICLVVGGHDC